MVTSLLPIIREENDYPSIIELRSTSQFDDFDVKCVNSLNDIIELFDIEIVVSSDWKVSSNLKYIQDFYISQGVLKKPIDITPNLMLVKNVRDRRSMEISKYLSNTSDISKFACVDDIHLYVSNFVWCKNVHLGISDPSVKNKIIKCFE